MESQHADANEELLLELTSKNTTRSIKDFSPEGIRLESNLEGEAKGVYNATFYATITMLVKLDQTIDYEVRQIHTTSDGDTVLVYYKGNSIIESPTVQPGQQRFVPLLPDPRLMPVPQPPPAGHP